MKVGDYEFELKNLKHSETFSEETNCFEGVLYVNGRKLACCDNDGHGGSTNVRFFPEHSEFGVEIEKFLKTQPKIKVEQFNFEFERRIEDIVDELVNQKLNEKFLQKIKDKTKKKLVFKDKNGKYISYTMGPGDIESQLQSPKIRVDIGKRIAVDMALGHTLVNEKIPSELMPKLTPKTNVKNKPRL